MLERRRVAFKPPPSFPPRADVWFRKKISYLIVKTYGAPKLNSFVVITEKNLVQTCEKRIVT